MEGETEERIAKAFGCYEVQQTVMRQVSVKDLKSLRLVDKFWKDSALFALKEKSQVALDSRDVFANYFKFLDDAVPICFSNYRIIFKPDNYESASEACKLFREFWDKCSPNVRELYIAIPWTCSFPILHYVFNNTAKPPVHLERLALSIEDVTDNNVEKWGVDSIPNQEEELDQQQHQPRDISSLISLSLNVSIVLASEKKVFPFNWLEFFRRCPNICQLSIQSDYGSGQFYRIVNAVVENQICLKMFKIGTRDQRLFCDDFLRMIGLVANNQMETVSLGFLPSIRHDSPLDTIFANSFSSLKHLSLLQYRTSNQATIIAFTASDANPFPNLTSLRVTKELVPNLNFLSKMPKLRRLEIYRDSTVGQHDTLSNPVIRTRTLPVISTLKTLILEPFVPVEHVWNLVRWFPNLRRLQMKANDVVARVIFMKWVNLRELYLVAEIERDNNDIVRSTLTDEGITGMSREVLQQQNCEEASNSCGPLRKMAYIGNLTELEVCKLQVVPDYQTGLTDYSIHFGLADLKKLSHLTVIKSLVSPAAAEFLQRRGVSVTISKD